MSQEQSNKLDLRSSVPFGIDMRLGIQGLEYNRIEVTLEEVPIQHEYFSEYKITTFPNSDSYTITASSDICNDRLTALDIFSQLQEELIVKYGSPSGQLADDDFDITIYFETDINPMTNWLFEDVLDDNVLLYWIMLRIVNHEVSGWVVTIHYLYKSGNDITTQSAL